MTVRFFTYSIRGDSLHRFNASLAAEASRPAVVPQLRDEGWLAKEATT
ncbi:MAG TPA: hypothetical protein VGU64_12425 [Terriglobales bacterium]|nr:hypothetical protein [Terriglobales bacterium]